MKPFLFLIVTMLILAVTLLMAGCTSTAPETGNGKPETGNQSNISPPSPPANATPPTCAEYCPTLPHVQCVGSWNISGTYPDCACGFVCTQSNASGSATPPPPQPPPGPEPPLATPTDKSVSQLLDAGMAKQRDDFYRANDGSFTEKSYKWLRQMPPGGGIVFDLAPASDVQFDDETISSIQASGFIVFENDDGGSEEAYGIAIFNDSRTVLDNYTGTDAFDVDYSSSIIDRRLRDCWAYTKDYNIDAEGGWLLTYYFRCERVLDK